MNDAELERWETERLMGIVDKLYCERLVLVERIVHFEGAWAARTGRFTVLAKERARLNKVDYRISSAQQQIKWRQEIRYPIRPQQQQHAGEQRQQQLEQQQPQQLAAAARRGEVHREEMEVMTRELSAAILSAATSEAQLADFERITIEQRRTAVRATVPQEEQEAQAGTLTPTANHTRSAPTPKFDEEVTREEKGEKEADGEREEEAGELGGEKTSRSDDGSTAEDGRRQEALQLPPLIERTSPIELACWVSPDAQEQVAPPARLVETRPAVTNVIPSYAKENVDEEMVSCTFSDRGFLGEEHRVSAEGEMMVARGKRGGDGRDEEDGVGTGKQQEHQPSPPPLPPPRLPLVVGMRVDLEPEQHALVVESRLVLAHRALVSYEKRKEEKEV